MRCAGLGGGQTSRSHQRDVKRRNRTLHGTYGEGLLQPQRRRNQAKQRGPRDENGAITLVGATVEFGDYRPDPARWFETGGGTHPDGFVVTARRIWLAGISAQRGY